jgi:4-hydroxyphenylpyruvate dioxygenase-like putative hemolysin
MHVLGVDRVMIATPDMAETRGQFEELLGLSFSEQMEPTTSTDHGEQAVANVISPAGVELVSPREEGNNEVARFLEQNGPGLYAISIRVADLDAAREELTEKGVDPVGQYAAENFAELFYHPRHFGGAMVILAEYEAPHPAVTSSG